jgi:V-type H+-transporting ATPase subunit a
MRSCAKELYHWIIKVRKTKSIYYTMNQFDYDVTRTMLVGEGWVPTADLDKVQEALNEGQRLSGSTVPPIMNKMDYGHLIPPTYFRTNKFTKIYQGIVNAYGTPTYQEANPGISLL